MSKKDSTLSVFDYMKGQNRPYSLTDIFNNLHKEVGKSAVQKALDVLVADKKLLEKSYGKQKVYLVNQDVFKASSDADIQTMDSKISELNEQLEKRQKEVNELETKLRALESEMTTKDANELLAKTGNEVDKLKEKLEALSQNTVVISTEERTRITRDKEKYGKEWKRRKRLANEMLDSILEGYPKGKKALYDELQIETDESAGVVP